MVTLLLLLSVYHIVPDCVTHYNNNNNTDYGSYRGYRKLNCHSTGDEEFYLLSLSQTSFENLIAQGYVTRLHKLYKTSFEQLYDDADVKAVMMVEH